MKHPNERYEAEEEPRCDECGCEIYGQAKRRLKLCNECYQVIKADYEFDRMRDDKLTGDM